MIHFDLWELVLNEELFLIDLKKLISKYLPSEKGEKLYREITKLLEEVIERIAWAG